MNLLGNLLVQPIIIIQQLHLKIFFLPLSNVTLPVPPSPVFFLLSSWNIIRSHYLRTCGPWLLQAQTGWTSVDPRDWGDLFFFISPVLLLTVPGSEAVKQEVDEDSQEQNWDCKKVRNDLQIDEWFFCQISLSPDELQLFFFCPLRTFQGPSPAKFLGSSEYFTVFSILAILWVFNDLHTELMNF